MNAKLLTALIVLVYFVPAHAQYCEQPRQQSLLSVLGPHTYEMDAPAADDGTWGGGMIATQAVTEIVVIGLSEACAGAAAAIAFRFNIADGSGMTTAEQNASILMLLAAGVLGQYAGVMLGGELWEGNGSGMYTLLGSVVGLGVGGGLTTILSAFEAPSWISVGLGVVTALTSPIVFYHASAADWRVLSKHGGGSVGLIPNDTQFNRSIADMEHKNNLASIRIRL